MDDRVGLQSVNEAKQAEKKKKEKNDRGGGLNGQLSPGLNCWLHTGRILIAAQKRTEYYMSTHISSYLNFRIFHPSSVH